MIERRLKEKLHEMFYASYTACRVKKGDKYYTYASGRKEKRDHKSYALTTLLTRSGAKTSKRTPKQFDIAYGPDQASAVLKRYEKAEANGDPKSVLPNSYIGTGLCEPVSYEGQPRRSHEKHYKALFYCAYFLNHEKIKKQMKDTGKLTIKEAFQTSINVSIALTREYHQKDKDSIYRGEKLGTAEGRYKASELQKMIEPLKDIEFNIVIKKTIYTNVRLIENIVPEINKETGKTECVNIKFSGLFFHDIDKVNRSFVLIPQGILERLQSIKNEMYGKDRKDGGLQEEW